jgi:phosphatidylglycerophosphatase A
MELSQKGIAGYFREGFRNFAQKCAPGIAPLPAGTSLKDPRILVATWFGAGLLRPAPGTMGSLAAIPFGVAITHFGGPFALLVSSLGLLYVGTPAADYYGKKSGAVDDHGIVVDEVAGLWLAAIPAEGHWDLWLLAFVLFRFFDIWKPWPASWFDNHGKTDPEGGGFDVMMDDIAAGFYALLGVGSIASFYL